MTYAMMPPALFAKLDTIRIVLTAQLASPPVGRHFTARVPDGHPGIGTHAAATLTGQKTGQ